MRYSVDVLNSSKNKVAELIGMVIARIREKVNGIALLTVETIEQSEWAYITAGTSFLRLQASDSGSCGTFRISEVKKSRAQERPCLSITARHILYDTSNELFSDSINCVNYTPSELVSLVLGYSSYNAGVVEPTTTIPFVRFEYETVIDCLQRICSLTGSELSLDENNGEVNILNQIGSSNGVIFRYGRNLKGASRTINMSRLVNKVYGAGGGEPPLLLTGATSSGGNKYASDTMSISSYGVYEGVYHDPTLEDVVNLVSTPALDGTYTSGLCENWAKMGTPTVSENTSSDYCLYGNASQRIQSTANEQGIQQSVSVTASNVYSLSVTLFLTSGTVRVEAADGTSVYKRVAPVTGSGMVTIRIENWKANNASVTVKIYQEGAGTADFYVDSVQIAEESRSKPFTIGKSADTLWNATVEYLDVYKNPEITYEVDLVDFYGDTRAGSEADKFKLGDIIMVIDPILDLNVSTRVMEREVNILQPWQVSVRLDNRSRTLADVFVAMRKAQEEGIKHQRAAHAESSQAAEVGSARLGFHNHAFRFFGTITINSWNSLSWSAGTLRVGDACYTISSGSATSLSTSSTYYFYFDRTSPTTFGNTTAMGNAEGEDRILIFAVTTTTDPTPCVVHPMGIIHE
ncbi:phage tail spike protein [Candidatus Latescibacterota bacterium]